jgi:hypothetical protein
LKLTGHRQSQSLCREEEIQSHIICISLKVWMALSSIYKTMISNFLVPPLLVPHKVDIITHSKIQCYRIPSITHFDNIKKKFLFHFGSISCILVGIWLLSQTHIASIFLKRVFGKACTNTFTFSMEQNWWHTRESYSHVVLLSM